MVTRMVTPMVMPMAMAMVKAMVMVMVMVMRLTNSIRACKVILSFALCPKYLMYPSPMCARLPTLVPEAVLPKMDLACRFAFVFACPVLVCNHVVVDTWNSFDCA